ncbi:hypothetical protein BLNAU_12339 [Blattamonas nauphoetae]|uniref:Uncharacterized protein n=1 Tax=Blattamonas nauphoetae TaxID=2049346 RepID=A0ABQ9XR70_9EUKA|nr:hypothetical protein BLNAU_12339 [Blattamonas nauphoetae]
MFFQQILRAYRSGSQKKNEEVKDIANMFEMTLADQVGKYEELTKMLKQCTDELWIVEMMIRDAEENDTHDSRNRTMKEAMDKAEKSAKEGITRDTLMKNYLITTQNDPLVKLREENEEQFRMSLTRTACDFDSIKPGNQKKEQIAQSHTFSCPADHFTIPPRYTCSIDTSLAKGAMQLHSQQLADSHGFISRTQSRSHQKQLQRPITILPITQDSRQLKHFPLENFPPIYQRTQL